MTNILHQNPTFTCAKDIAEICKPLRDLNIDYFSHVKVDHNRDFSFICSNPGFVDVYFAKRYFNIDITTAVDGFGRYVIWDDVPRAGKTLDMEYDAIQFGVKHTFTIIQKNKSHVDFYSFSSSVESKAINQVYVANLELLNLFIYHFEQTLAESKKLSSAYDQKFSVDNDAEGFTVDDNGLLLPKNKISEYHAKLSIPRLSAREEECVRLASHGKSGKAISESLCISRRTVEAHLESAKIKFNVSSKFHLIENWMKMHYLSGDSL